MTVQEVVTAVKQAGFDESEAVVKGWVLQRLRVMVARAKWRVMDITIGTTVADQAQYYLDPSVVDLRSVRVGGVPYDPISPRDLDELKMGWATKSGPGGLFTQAFGRDFDAEFIELWPAPVESGVLISGLAAWQPAPVPDSSELPIPADLHHYVLEGAIADGLARSDERLQEADRFEARFEQGVQLLSQRRNARHTAGPSRIRVG